MVGKRKPVFLLLFAGILVLYALIIQFTGVGLPCLFRKKTGYLCPGCGITHMLMAMLAGDYHAAYRANPYLFVTFPFLCWLCGRMLYGWLAEKSVLQGKVEKRLLVFYLAGLLIFGIVRNI